MTVTAYIPRKVRGRVRELAYADYARLAQIHAALRPHGFEDLYEQTGLGNEVPAPSNPNTREVAVGIKVASRSLRAGTRTARMGDVVIAMNRMFEEG